MNAPRKDVVTTLVNQDATYIGYSFMFPKGAKIRVKTRVDDYKNQRSVFHAHFSHPILKTGTDVTFDAVTLRNTDWDEKEDAQHAFHISLDLSSLDLTGLPEQPSF